MTQMKGCTNCTKKKSPHYYDSVKPQQLIAELNNGEIQNDDYFGRSYNLLPDINTAPPPRSNPHDQQAENAFHIYELHKILQPNYKSMEHGFTRMKDGLWYLASKTTLENCTGEMIEWWFNHCDSSERFKWWHPTCNVHGEFDPTFYAVQPEDRLVGHAIGHRFTCVKKLYSSGGVCGNNGDDNGLGDEVLQHIDYIHPAEYINIDELPAVGITACIIGKISYHDHHLGEINVGHVCHIVREHMGQVTLVTRMWLGSIDKTDDNFPSPRFVNYIGNTWLYRYMKFTATFIKNIWIQMVQENNCLAEFLPDFYVQELIELEQRKLRNIALLEASKTYNEFEEFSEEEVEEGQHYEEQSKSEESEPENLKEDGRRGIPSSTNDFAEESMSDSEEQGQGQGQILDAQLFHQESNKHLALSKDNFYAYDSHDDEKGQVSDDDVAGNGRGRRRRSKSTEKSNRKAKGSAEVVGKAGSGGGGQQAVSSSALVSTSSRVGKGIGV